MRRNRRVSAVVPAWAYDAVWYQIFPERFRNGSSANDPTAETIGAAQVEGWRAYPWGADWYGRQPWEVARGDFYHSVYLRRYGGDLQGVIDKLDYLRDLGINAIYLNPVFTAPSLHKYDGSTFHHIDPSFGPDLDGDRRRIELAGETDDPATWIWTSADRLFLKLLRRAHARGFKVILDGVFNHTGRRFFAFEDLERSGPRSAYAGWYRNLRWRRDGSFTCRCWFNHKALPEFARTRSDLAPPVKRYIFNVTRRWMDPDGDGDPADGIDGWRLDVAHCVPLGFWRSWRKLVKRLNPQAYLTGEIVTFARKYLRGDVFDGVMNYVWLFAAVDFFSPSRKPISARALKRRLNEMRQGYPLPAQHAVQNLLDSHDVARILTMLQNPDAPRRTWEDYFHCSRARNHPDFDTRRPGRKARTVLRQLLVFQAAYLGAPMLYYGTEVGMWGANDPDNRQPMPWEDLPAEPETHTPRGKCRAQSRAPDYGLRAFVTRVTALRHRHVSLRRGRLHWLPSPSTRLLGFARATDEERVVAWFNASDRPVAVGWKGKGWNLWNGKAIRQGPLKLPPRGWALIQVTEP